MVSRRCRYDDDDEALARSKPQFCNNPAESGWIKTRIYYAVGNNPPPPPPEPDVGRLVVGAVGLVVDGGGEKLNVGRNFPFIKSNFAKPFLSSAARASEGAGKKDDFFLIHFSPRVMNKERKDGWQFSTMPPFFRWAV